MHTLRTLQSPRRTLSVASGTRSVGRVTRLRWPSRSACNENVSRRDPSHPSAFSDSVVSERLKVYLRQTQPLVDYYRERPTFRVVNGAQPPERVAHELDTVIGDAAAMGAAMGTERT